MERMKGLADKLNRSGRLRRQRGAGVFLLLLVIAGFTAAAGMYSFYRIDTVAVESVRRTTDVIASTKAALIGYAVRAGRTTCSDPGNALVCNAELAERPGDLPCPDTNNDGIAEPTCRTGSPLIHDSHIGRVPWRTLGIPEPKDAAGETLWYAISSEFRNRASFPTSGSITSANHALNSDSRGTILVRAADPGCWADPTTCPQLADDAVAVIFSPGMTQGPQSRAGSLQGLVLCNAVGLSVGRDACPSNYLETVTINATTRVVTAAYVPTRPIPNVNDQVAYITTAEIIPQVELRVAGEVKKLLEGYRAQSGCQCYPWAEDWPYLGGIADLGQNRGRFPTQASPHDWGTDGIPALPPWLESNNWHNLIWYSVGKENSDTAGRICRSCSALTRLRVITQESPLVATDVSVVFFLPGTPAGGVPRLPRPHTASLSTAQRNITDDLTRYLEDTYNNDGANIATCPVTGETGGNVCTTANCYTIIPGETSCDTFIVPQSRAHDRNRLYTLTSEPPNVCRGAGRVLIDSGPCRVTGNTIDAICVNAVAAIRAAGCPAPCIDAADTMIVAPCRNHHHTSQCVAAIATLKACTS